MQGIRSFNNTFSDGGVRLELTPTTTSPLAIEVGESVESRIKRLISENPVVIFTRSTSCCMCHVMKRLLSTIGVHPTVIELEDDDEISALQGYDTSSSSSSSAASTSSPVVFIGAARVGGLENLVALHLSNHLVPMLTQAGALP
ncbi:Glutaredoxin [Dillenia turbinata]|uniref:Glutaredoxin n=1 Tax=Dillenia turbinata TaxID=194707 RepID=A0AAN8UJC1_9MAGN